MDTNRAFTKISPKQMGFLVHEMVAYYVSDLSRKDRQVQRDTDSKSELLSYFLSRWVVSMTGCYCEWPAVRDYLRLYTLPNNRTPEEWQSDLEDMLEDGKVTQ
jgi:hypothetical protein